MKLFKVINGILTQTDAEIPTINQEEVLVKIHAVSLNYRDLLVTEGVGQWKPKENRIPVSDGAGEVIKVGGAVRKFEIGDRVTTLLSPNWVSGRLAPEKLIGTLGGSARDGILAEYVALPANALAKFPDYLSYEEAATLPIAALTAWNAVVEQSTLKLGDSILIIGTGGVSVFSLQFAKLAGYQIIITSSSDEKLKEAKALGAHHTVNYKKNTDWVEEVMNITHGKGVDQVIDIVGGDHINESLKCLKSEGTISMIGVISGVFGSIETGKIMSKAAKIQGVETGSTEMYERMLQAMDVHKLKPVINKIFPFSETLDAFSFLKNGNHMGKICIRLAEA